MDDKVQAASHLEIGHKILLHEYGKTHGIYLDYLQAAIQVNFETQIVSDEEYNGIVQEQMELQASLNQGNPEPLIG